MLLMSKATQCGILILIIASGMFVRPEHSQAAVTAEQRRELQQIRRGLTKVRLLLRRDKIDEAKELVEGATQRLDELIEKDGVDEGERIIASLRKLIESNRQAIQKQTGTKPAPTADVPASDVDIPRPSGGETISFTRDIVPFMANICLRCHSGESPRSGFSLETFEKLMIGGDSGQVLLPGDLDGSRLWDLVGKQQPFKMPPGANLLITRRNHSDLRTWILEGAKFDGKDPKAKLRTLIPSAADKKTAKFAEMSSSEFSDFRLQRSHQQWKSVLPREQPQVVEGEQVVAMGNVAEERLQQAVMWGEEHVRELAKFFGDESQPVWKGRLALFLFKDRYGYDEFNTTIEERQIPRAVVGHATVDSTFEDAYVAMMDVGDLATAESPSLSGSVMEFVTAAYLKRSGKLPAWLVSGTGLAMAAQSDRRAAYFQTLRSSVSKQLDRVQSPEQLFAADTFSPTSVGPIGLTLVEFLWKLRDRRAFKRFVAALQEGHTLDAAFENEYGVTTAAVCRAYLAKQR